MARDGYGFPLLVRRLWLRCRRQCEPTERQKRVIAVTAIKCLMSDIISLFRIRCSLSRSKTLENILLLNYWVFIVLNVCLSSVIAPNSVHSWLSSSVIDWRLARNDIKHWFRVLNSFFSSFAIVFIYFISIFQFSVSSLSLIFESNAKLHWIFVNWWIKFSVYLSAKLFSLAFRDIFSIIRFCLWERFSLKNFASRTANERQRTWKLMELSLKLNLILRLIRNSYSHWTLAAIK